MINQIDILRLFQQCQSESIRRHNNLVEQMSAANEFQGKMLRKQAIDFFRDILTHTYSKSESYNKAIIAVGYAGYFAILSSVKTIISSQLLLWSSLFMIISIMIFVVNEVYNMISTAHFLSHASKALQTEAVNLDIQVLINKWQDKIKNRESEQMRVWLITLIPTIAFALLSISLLLIGYINSIVASIKI